MSKAVADSPSPVAKILAAINNVTTKVGTLAKAGHNSDQNYDYAKASDLMAKLQPLLIEQGLVIIPSEVAHHVLEGSVLAVTYEFTIGLNTGETLPDKPKFTGMARLVSKSGTADDKAGNKTLTAASKYFAIQLFKIPTVDVDISDGDAGGDVSGRRETPPPAPQQTAKPQVAPPLDPKTGEPAAPHEIEVGQKSWIEWGSQFVAAIETSKTPTDAAQWQITNSKALTGMNKGAPRAKERVTARIEAVSERVATALIDNLAAEFLKATDQRGLDSVWNKNNEHIICMSKANQDRAAVIYEADAKRFKSANPLAA